MRILLALCICVAGVCAFSSIDDKMEKEYGRLAILSDCLGPRVFGHYVKAVSDAVTACRNRPFVPPQSQLSRQNPGNQKVDIMFDRESVQKLSIKMRLAFSNSSCVLRELGYIDNSYNIKYETIIGEIREVGRSDKQLMEDLLRAINMCRDFTTCIPLDKIQFPMREPEMRYLNFNVCFNQATIGACLKKQFRGHQPNYDYIAAQNIFGASSGDDKMISLLWRETAGLF